MSKFIFIAGPCSVESEEQIISIALDWGVAYWSVAADIRKE